MMKLGTVLLLLGMAIIPVFWGAGIWAFFTSPEIPLIVKLAAGSFISGAFLIVLAALRERWGEKDKYSEVKE